MNVFQNSDRIIVSVKINNHKIEEVLDTAETLAPTETIENEIKRLRKWLPYVPLIKNPVTNAITKISTSRNRDFNTYDQLLATTFANAFIILGIASFSAKMAHQ